MSFHDTNHIKKSRTEHFCSFCNQKLPIGSSCVQHKGTLDGDFYSYYLCHRCDRLVSESSGEGDDIWTDSHEGTINNLWDGFSNWLDHATIVCPHCESRTLHDYDIDDKAENVVFICNDCEKEYTMELNSDNLLAKTNKITNNHTN